jgi:hypothetical protein
MKPEPRQLEIVQAFGPVQHIQYLNAPLYQILPHAAAFACLE